MRIKSYFADSVQEAIEKARLELGTEAMLMNSKKTEPELRPLGAYEVVFGIAGGAAARPPEARLEAQSGVRLTTKTEAKIQPGAAAGDFTRPEELVRELADLRKQIETVRRSVNRHGRSAAAAGARPGSEVDEICARLAAAGFSEELAAEIAEAVELQLAGRTGAMRARREAGTSALELTTLALESELERRLAVAPAPGAPGTKTAAVLFAGPAGAGKTTSLIKLALRCGLQTGVPVQILSLDTLRVGGWEQLASYARITGLAFDVIHHLNAFGQALAEGRHKKLILIDTPGFSPAELQEIPELAEWLARETAVEVQLVLPAVLCPRVAQRAVERFAAFRPAKLLFTHWDELETPGGALEVAMRSALPISYLADGQQIPEDIHEASKARLLEYFTAAPRQVAASAA
jgi:flagellar biosynthesis protein FlhF